MSDHPQNGFQVYKQNLMNLEHHKRNTRRHTLDDYTDMGKVIEK